MATIVSEDVYKEILGSLFDQIIMIKKFEPDHPTWVQKSPDIDPPGETDPHRDPNGKINIFKTGRIVNNQFVVTNNLGEDKIIEEKAKLMYILAHLIEANLKKHTD